MLVPPRREEDKPAIQYGTESPTKRVLARYTSELGERCQLGHIHSYDSTVSRGELLPFRLQPERHNFVIVPKWIVLYHFEPTLLGNEVQNIRFTKQP